MAQAQMHPKMSTIPRPMSHWTSQKDWKFFINDIHVTKAKPKPKILASFGSEFNASLFCLNRYPIYMNNVAHAQGEKGETGPQGEHIYMNNVAHAPA